MITGKNVGRINLVIFSAGGVFVSGALGSCHVNPSYYRYLRCFCSSLVSVLIFSSGFLPVAIGCMLCSYVLAVMVLLIISCSMVLPPSVIVYCLSLVWRAS